MVGSGGGVGEVLAKEAAEQTQSNALKVSFEEEVDRIDARLALKDLPSAERAELERERETLLKSADYLGVERRMTREEREKRSEEHTSELQSLMRISYAVFCLKKKT